MDEFSIMVTDVEDEENRRKLLEAGEDEEVDKKRGRVDVAGRERDSMGRDRRRCVL